MQEIDVRLSTLIRIGIEKTSPLTGGLVNAEATKTCAFGAALYGAARLFAGCVPSERGIANARKIGNISDVVRRRIHHIPGGSNAVTPVGAQLDYVITTLNDKKGWTRERIASYVDELIDVHGYDLTVNLRAQITPEDCGFNDENTHHVDEGRLPNTSLDKIIEAVGLKSNGDSLPETPENISIKPTEEEKTHV